MKLVLDTHALVWWVSGIEKLSQSASRLIKQNLEVENSIQISAISAWEIAMLVKKGRLVLSMDVDSWLHQVALLPAVQFAPIDVDLAVKSTLLPGSFHKDPADRMIVSLARNLALPLVTADEKILAYKHVKTIW